MVVVVGIEIYMFCCNGGRTHPSDMILLSIFTLAEAYIVSFISSITGAQSGNQIVLMAAALTLAMVLACTVYAVLTPTDFTTSYAIVIMLTVVLLVLWVILLFTDSKVLTLIYCGVGVMLFGIYLVIDTQMIMGGRGIEIGIDEHCFAAMILYIDIIQIFLYLLEFLQTLNRD